MSTVGKLNRGRYANGSSDDGCALWKHGHENRIPHPTPSHTSRKDWHEAYLPELIILYGIYAELIDERYPTARVKWGNETFNAFTRMMYSCSSGYISSHLERAYEDSDSD